MDAEFVGAAPAASEKSSVPRTMGRNLEGGGGNGKGKRR